MIILSIIVQRDGVISDIKSYYCNVADRDEIPRSELNKIEQEYCKTVRKFGAITGEAWSDEQILDHYSWAYCEDAYDIELVYSDETEQIYPHL